MRIVSLFLYLFFSSLVLIPFIIFTFITSLNSCNTDINTDIDCNNRGTVDEEDCKILASRQEQVALHIFNFYLNLHSKEVL